MKIGVLSDIHGNHYALKKVLEQARRESIDELLILGDFVGYYYHPEKIFELLKNWKFQAIRGNHENILFGLIKGDLLEADVKLKYGSGHSIAMTILSESQLSFLDKLPEQINVSFEGLNLMLCHGAPFDKNLYLYPDASNELLEKCDFDGVDFILVGHSHFAFCKRNRYSTLINVGSVGQSRNQSGMAQWTIINSKTGAFEMRSTQYDVSRLIAEVEIQDPDNSYLKEVLVRNSQNDEI